MAQSTNNSLPSTHKSAQSGIGRDGTSQRSRHLDALDPQHARIDDRTLPDFLAFARALGHELTYFNAADQADGDFSSFIDPAWRLDDIARLVADAGAENSSPAALADAASAPAVRPHQALFLAFLHLMQTATEQMNSLTGRHLEFFYRDVLGLARRAPIADRVHVLCRPARSKGKAPDQGVLVPAGTLLDAGKDSSGKRRAYATERDTVIGRAEVARLSSIHVERRITTLSSVHEQHPGDVDGALLAMLTLALGDPEPGEPVPHYNGAEPVDMALITRLRGQVTFARSALSMEFHELATIVRLLDNRSQESAEWTQINQSLESAAHNRPDGAGFAITPADSRDFDSNLEGAIGGPLDFAGLADVVAVEDLYYQRARPEVADFITKVLYFDVDAFASMMQSVLRIRAEWREVNRILERCGRRQRDDENYRLQPADASAFAANLTDAVGAPDWTQVDVADIVEYHQQIGIIEKAFHMPAEDFALLLAVHNAQNSATAWLDSDWSRVYQLLAEAHDRAEYARRRRALSDLGTGAASAEDGLRAVLATVLGHAETSAAEPVPVLAEKMRAYVASEADLDVLRIAAHAASLPAGISADTWSAIAAIVERAQRGLPGWQAPVAERREWLHLHAHADATQVISTLGIEGDDETPRFKPFGRPRPVNDRDTQPEPTLGWAISTPVLAMAAGQRTIRLTLGFATDSFDATRIEAALANQPFAVSLSTADGHRPANATVTHGDYTALSGSSDPLADPLAALQVIVDLGADQDPVVAIADESGPNPRAPTLSLVLQPVWDDSHGRYITPYEAFADLVLEAVHVAVHVQGLGDLAVENDTAQLDASKPFTPFGSSPTVGSRLYIAHPELSSKRLDSVSFQLRWMDAPAELGAHYAAYGLTADASVPDFRARIALIDRRRELTLSDGEALFAATGARDAHAITIADVPDAVAQANPTIDYQSLPALPDADDAERPASTWQRAFVWQMSAPDFQHRQYPRLVTRMGAQMAADIAASAAGGPAVDIDNYQVEAPYTPTLERLVADYTASSEIRLRDTRSADAGDDEFIYHLHPFGHSALQPTSAEQAYFLPRYHAHAGALYLGLRAIHPPQNLSLLVQLAEGSADPDLTPASVEWSYLSGNRWLSLHHGGIIADGTRGLQKTGILELSLPAARPSTLLDSQLYWLRAAVADNVASVCDVVAIHPNAVSAVFVDRNNAPDCYDSPLPAGSIGKLLAPVPGLAGVDQPYASFGSRPAERERGFNTRVSERLRHKQRALTLWDYEHLVLERFPHIYKAKCIPADASTEPGQVRLVVIPEMRGRIPFDPFAPKAPASTLADVAAYLTDAAPPEARLSVHNARFVAIKVRVQVKFWPGRDEGFYKQQLSEELCRFLAPWAYDEGVDIVMGNRIYASSIVDFIERRPYIDFVAGITLLRGHSDDFVEVARPQAGADPSADSLYAGGYHVAAERPDEVLVAARVHEIDTSWQFQVELPDELRLDAGDDNAPAGIGKMGIGFNFIVGSDIADSGINGMAIEVDFQVG